MAVAKWNTPSAVGSNIAGTTLDALANGAASAFITYDNSSNLDLYASVQVDLGSIAAAAGASITLAVFATQNNVQPDNTTSVSGGDTYTAPLLVSTSVKVVNFPMVRLFPESLRLSIINNSGVTFAGSGNALKVRPYNENVT